MMLANYHHDKNYLFLPHEDKLYSFQDAIEEAKKYDTKLIGIKIRSLEELSHCNQFPIVVNLREKSRAPHSVLVTKINKRFVYYYDPAFGKKKEKWTYFAEKWTKQALIVEELTKVKCPFIPPTFVAQRDRFTLPILQLLSGLSLLSATYFIDKEFPIYLPIALFSGFVIFEMLFRQNLMGAMKRMDEILYTYSLVCPKEHYFTLYQDVEKLRYITFTKYQNVLYSCLVTTFLTFLLVINAKINAIYVLLSLLLALLEVIFIRPREKQKSEDIAKLEEEVKNAENEYQFNFFSKEARESSYKLGLSKSIFSYLNIAMMLMVIILVMAITDSVNITYVVFYLCASIFMKNEFTNIFMYSTTSEDFDSCKNKVVQSLKNE